MIDQKTRLQKEFQHEILGTEKVKIYFWMKCYIMNAQWMFNEENQIITNCNNKFYKMKFNCHLTLIKFFLDFFNWVYLWAVAGSNSYNLIFLKEKMWFYSDIIIFINQCIISFIEGKIFKNACGFSHCVIH